MSKPLSGRIAVVTGGGTGIGLAVAEKLVDAGCKVVITGRREEVIRSAAERIAASGYVMDVRDKASVERCFDSIKGDLGLVTILVGNAGVGKFGPSDMVTSDEFAAQMDTNVNGLFYSNVAAISHMREAGGGDIVNILSVMSIIAMPQSAAYTASKWAALGLTKSLNAEYRAENVRISAVLPGATDTPIWDNLGVQLDPASMLKPDDVAEGVLFCLNQPQSSAIEELQIMPKAGIL